MDISSGTRAFGALAQETRLKVFRLLIQAGPDGLPAGRISSMLGVPHNTLSSHLSILANAGLIASRREGRSIIYFADLDGVRGLLIFLMQDCCEGQPELCASMLKAVLPHDTEVTNER